MVAASAGSVWYARNDVVGIVPGATYTIGGWVRTASGNESVFLAGQWFGANNVVIGSQVGGSVITVAGSSWGALTPSSVVAPVGATRLEVRVIGVTSTPGTVTYLDDLSVQRT
jgi:hypothetical protein